MLHVTYQPTDQWQVRETGDRYCSDSCCGKKAQWTLVPADIYSIKWLVFCQIFFCVHEVLDAYQSSMQPNRLGGLVLSY